MNFHTVRCLPFLCLLLVPGWASALGLGDLRGQTYLGQSLSVEIPLVGGEKTNLDPACFRLVQPAGAGDMPWLKKATLSVRKGSLPVLVIRSETPLREPILQLAVELGCGHEISREYVLLASPAQEGQQAVQEKTVGGASSSLPVRSESRSERLRSAPKSMNTAPRPVVPLRREPRMEVNPLHDRVMLSNDAGFDELSLRFSTDLSISGADAVREEQREILRLEFRMLQALNDQAISQLATAEKLRNMEATLGELQKHAATFSERIDSGVANTVPVDAPTQAVAAPASVQAPVNKPDSSSTKGSGVEWLSEWTLYGLLAGALLGLAGWLGWREYRERREILAREAELFSPSVTDVDPKRVDEFDDVDFHLGLSPAGMQMPVDVELDVGEAKASDPLPSEQKKTPLGHDSIMSIGSATTVDEHFEANPVMELADIMLSFGRVKGAAQALQEYIDNNPQEALQPWIRLMDVYRMAGMRSEFENVARNLNQHFNVEVQNWDDAPLLPEAASAEVSSDKAHALELVPVETLRPGSIEDMPRLMNAIIEQWSSGDVVGYLYQLLRDNRGGKRAGFALQVVEDILFLIELKETSNRMEKEGVVAAA